MHAGKRVGDFLEPISGAAQRVTMIVRDTGIRFPADVDARHRRHWDCNWSTP
jgi:hypothetical protein